MAMTQEPILSRLDRLDNLMRHLEEMRRGSSRSTKSSSPSTPSSGTHVSESLFDFSPRSRDKLHCRPIDDVIVETEHKGTLLDRVALMEDRLLKLEQEMEVEKQDMVMKEDKSHQPKKGLKQFVKACVQGNKGRPKKNFQT